MKTISIKGFKKFKLPIIVPKKTYAEQLYGRYESFLSASHSTMSYIEFLEKTCQGLEGVADWTEIN